jgi:hypothetical protein
MNNVGDVPPYPMMKPTMSQLYGYAIAKRCV